MLGSCCMLAFCLVYARLVAFHMAYGVAFAFSAWLVPGRHGLLY
jgi:hypothetical protein